MDYALRYDHVTKQGFKLSLVPYLSEIRPENKGYYLAVDDQIEGLWPGEEAANEAHEDLKFGHIDAIVPSPKGYMTFQSRNDFSVNNLSDWQSKNVLRKVL
ncbi:hypothetical protein SAMN05421762_2506 [Pseudooceanicola nitratireducens]|jgi:hypothetical protein|uniref:Uncharacterized protein n=1 Tax=Pseudooceanicola nitratireducens TaxID=517719 RepID=A0A1I1MUH4_9RHOB|nr:hypothetical protein [Pseudooceanicola nitratireducens]SEI83683.1 hypothetical protein SAMN05216183_101834 [Pseudooceanicola nitratireducens]SFC86858.1 hypothetical protein SAMN05421762_2506 [Pseudooceanicola nitratireducens]